MNIQSILKQTALIIRQNGKNLIQKQSCLRNLPTTQFKMASALQNRFIQKNYFMMSSQQQNDDSEELKNHLKQQKMKLKMNMEFQSSTIVEEDCYNLYPIVIEDGSAEDALDLGKTMLDYVERMEKQSISGKQQIIHSLNIQIIRCYGHITTSFGYLKSDKNELADQEITNESKFNSDQRFLIVSNIVSILSLLQQSSKCKFLVKYLLSELKSGFKESEAMDDSQYEMGYKSILLYIVSLIQQNNHDAIKEVIQESQFLDIDWLYSNNEQIPIAFVPIGNSLSCLGSYFKEKGEKERAFKYLAYSADIFEQLEGKDSPNVHYLQSELDKFK